MTTVSGLKNMVQKVLWPRAQEPFTDMSSLATRLEQSAIHLRDQIWRLEKANATNEKLTDKLVTVIEKQKEKIQEATNVAEHAIQEVKEQLEEKGKH